MVKKTEQCWKGVIFKPNAPINLLWNMFSSSTIPYVHKQFKKTQTKQQLPAYKI